MRRAKMDSFRLIGSGAGQMADDVYEIPWEYNSAAAKLRQNGQPTCGVTASKLRRDPAPPKPPRAANGVAVWTYRGPEDDDRPQGEYDAPWDWKKRPQRQSTQIYDPVCEDEPKTATVAEKVKLFSRRSNENERNAKTQSLCISNETEKVVKPRSPTNLSSESSGSADTLCKCREGVSPRTPLMETAFCSKAPKKSVLDSKQERKNRLIQQVVSGETSSIKPKPARSKAKLQKTGEKSKPPPKLPSPANAKVVDKRTFVPKLGLESANNSINSDAPCCSKRDVLEEKLENGQLEYDVPWEFCARKKLMHKLVQKQDVCGPSSAKLDRQGLSLNFGCAGLNPSADTFDPSLALEKQQWYHGNIARSEAEQRLAKAKEGSYLVRLCETNKEEYALSLKSARGYMHMKIQQTESGGWVLGYFSQPFDEIPRMIKYYSINKLPIKGAEHMCLLYPVNEHYL